MIIAQENFLSTCSQKIIDQGFKNSCCSLPDIVIKNILNFLLDNETNGSLENNEFTFEVKSEEDFTGLSLVLMNTIQELGSLYDGSSQDSASNKPNNENIEGQNNKEKVTEEEEEQDKLDATIDNLVYETSKAASPMLTRDEITTPKLEMFGEEEPSQVENLIDLKLDNNRDKINIQKSKSSTIIVEKEELGDPNLPEFWQKIKEDFAKNKTSIYNNDSTASANPIEIINATNSHISTNNNNVILTRKTSSAKILLNHNTPNHLIFPGPLRSSPEKKAIDLLELGKNNNSSQPSKFDLDSLARNLASLKQLDQASKMNNNSSSPISDTKDKNQENNNNNLASVADLDLIRNSLATDQRLKQILSLPSGSNVSNQKSEQNQNENKTINNHKNKNENPITNNGTIQPSLRNRLIRKCQYCNKEFDKKWNYDRHMNHEMKLKPHVCEVCTKTFTDKGSKKHHIKKSHPDFLNELEIREKQELLQGALASSQINLDDLIKLSKDTSNNSSSASASSKNNNNNNNSSVSLDEILKNCQPKTNYQDKIKIPTTKINSISIPVLNGNLNHNGKNASQSARSINVSKENTPPQSVQSTQNKQQIKIVDINKKTDRKIDRIEMPTPPSSNSSHVKNTNKTTMKSSSLTTGISGNKRSAIVINTKKANEPVTISSKNVPKIDKVEDVIQPLKKRILTAETSKDATMNLTKGARTSRT